MKKNIIIVLAICVLMITTIGKALADDSGNIIYGPKVYPSITPKNQQELESKGINFKKLDYLKAYQYAIADEKTLYLVVSTKKGTFELADIILSDGKRQIISETRSDLSLSRPTIYVFRTKKPESSLFIIYEYAEKINKNLEIYKEDGKGSYQSLNKEKIPLQSKIFLSDANNDGYQDILIWGRLKTREKEIPNVGEMSVMLFDPQSNKFLSAKPLR